MWISYILYAICMVFVINCVEADDSRYRWVCQKGKCLKMKTQRDLSGKVPGFSLECCRMMCNKYGLLWPRPTGNTNLANHFYKIDLYSIDIQIKKPGATDDLMRAAVKRFRRTVALSIPPGVKPNTSGNTLIVYLVNEDPNNRDFSLDMKENYTVMVKRSVRGDGKVFAIATVTGGSFFGVRHGLETLAQLIVYDDDHLLVIGHVEIIDKPVYPYRGILLDTSRNYYPIDSIKKTIDAMATVKLNTFHWHIIDSHSFPFVSERRPILSKDGAYSPDKIYTKAAIREVVRFGLERGVRVLPEFDAPAHVGEGWQDTGLTVCFMEEPWVNFCAEPPCGQLNPVKEGVYDVLEDIYRDMAEAFNPDMFHMGGDEVYGTCWNISAQIQEFIVRRRWPLNETTSFLKLWAYFQKKAQQRAYKAFGKKLPLILWNSHLTKWSDVDQYLDKNDYVVQVWTTSANIQILNLLKVGYRVIMSNSDSLYLDCGFGAWIGSGNNWCSPYNGWKKVYDHSPAVLGLEYADQILGGEATLWSEQVDPATLDGRVWPRAAALAERLWTEPETTWEEAEYRMMHTRQRLVRMGIHAESIQPEWCYKNEGYCYPQSTQDIPTVILDHEVNPVGTAADYAGLALFLGFVIGLTLLALGAAILRLIVFFILRLSLFSGRAVFIRGFKGCGRRVLGGASRPPSMKKNFF